ncbi:MBL fold metallo-hydrolase [Patescibacteria group bacterium]
MPKPRLKTAYREVLIAIVPVILIALVARLAMGNLNWNDMFGSSQSSLEGMVVERSEDLATVPDEQHNLWVEIKNQGDQVWQQTGDDSVYLMTEDGQPSLLYTANSTWHSESLVRLFEDQVLPGETGHFNFTIKTDLPVGEYPVKFNVIDEKYEELEGVKPVIWNINIEEPSYGFELISQSDNPTITRGQLGTLESRYKNTGNTTWRNHGEHPVLLKTDVDESQSPFYTDIRWPGEDVVTYLDEPIVRPGEEGTFTYEVRAPDSLGVTRVNFTPEVLGVSDADTQSVAFDIAVAESGQPRVFDRQHEDQVADSEFLRMYALPVGHGDCYIFITPAKEIVVFDTGHPNRANVVVNALKRLGVDKIDYLILSHPHWDHIGGAPYIMDVYPAEKIYANGEGYPYDTYARLAEYFRGDGSNVELVADGSMINVADDLRIEFLNPETTLTEIAENDEEINNNSLVARLAWRGRSILLPSDIYTSSVERLLNAGKDLQADILALPHHGNDGFGEVEQNFLQTVAPQAVIKSSDWTELQNETSPEMLKTLQNIGVEFLATARDGELHITLPPDSETINVQSGNLVWSN